MHACRVKISTTTDNHTTEIVRNGELEITPKRIRLSYTEKNAKVLLALEDGVTTIDRQGDYTMRLRLQKGEYCAGVLGIGGCEGEVYTKTSRIAYTTREEGCTLDLHYDLIVGEETQRMRIRILAKII